MSVIHEMLSGLHLPAFMPENAKPAEWASIRKQMIDVLLDQEYGVIPPLPCTVEGKIVEEDDSFFAGKCVFERIEMTVTLPGGSFTFPCCLCMPKTPGEHPLFVLLNFRPDVPDRYLPSEEACDRGYAVLSVGYNDVSKDAADDYTEGLGRLLREAAAEAGVAKDKLPGKIAIWAWTASRMLDWALTQPRVCHEHVAVMGHSRLGKAALVAGMLDERFKCIVSNDSGCSGAAITRGKPGEHVADITRQFPFWFCEAYQQYANREESMPFEQDWLLAALAPRLVIVGSAEEDEWAGPSHEYLSCVSAGKAWELLGREGFVHPDRLPQPCDVLHEGSIGYHLRHGMHFLSREDWNRYMDFLDAKGWLG